MVAYRHAMHERVGVVGPLPQQGINGAPRNRYAPLHQRECGAVTQHRTVTQAMPQAASHTDAWCVVSCSHTFSQGCCSSSSAVQLWLCLPKPQHAPIKSRTELDPDGCQVRRPYRPTPTPPVTNTASFSTSMAPSHPAGRLAGSGGWQISLSLPCSNTSSSTAATPQVSTALL